MASKSVGKSENIGYGFGFIRNRLFAACTSRRGEDPSCFAFPFSTISPGPLLSFFLPSFLPSRLLSLLSSCSGSADAVSRRRKTNPPRRQTIRRRRRSLCMHVDVDATIHRRAARARADRGRMIAASASLSRWLGWSATAERERARLEPTKRRRGDPSCS